MSFIRAAVLAALALAGSACTTWTWVSTRAEAVDLAADSDCASLLAGVRERGLEPHVESDEDEFPSLALAVDETLILRARAERIVLGRSLTVGYETPRGWTATLRCPELGQRELEVRTCSARGRRFGVIDPRPLADWLGAGTPGRPCELLLVHELRRERVPHHHKALVRRSIRPWLEGPS